MRVNLKEKIKKTVDIQQNQDAFDKLRLENGELKKELEKERLLHKMLYKEWEKLNGQLSDRENEVYDSKPKNLFYKYAFYVLLIAAIPAFYFLYPRIGNEKTSSSSQAASVPIVTSDSTATTASGSVKDSISKRDSILTMKEKPTRNQDAIQQPVIKSEEKKAVLPDSSKPAKIAVHKPVVETQLTDDIRDSISSEGFNAYFDHSRNPFKKSSERYKVWAEGWNEGQAEAKKVLIKDSAEK